MYFDDLALVTFEAYRHQFITPEEIGNRSHSQRWTFPASIFFATTVITTIGYGNMVPITVYGRVFCIGFGLFGIPLLLVTIADIGKFLSDFLSFLYRLYRRFTRKLKKHSRKLSSRMSRSSRSSSRSSPEKSMSPGLNLPPVDDSETSSEDELRIPVIMVMLVLISYTALGGLLFRMWEGWPYFEAFYFCFITMATIGFGDLVPTEQVYMFFTMAYIVVGLALATMCIDLDFQHILLKNRKRAMRMDVRFLAGTEYIRKIHYVGHKIESAKEMVGAGLVSGLQVGEHLLKHTGYGFIRTAGGKIIHASVLHRKRYGDIDDEYITERNILYAPLSPAVLKHVKAHIKLHPEDIHEKDGYILQNKVFNQPPMRRAYHFSPEAIQRRFYRSGTFPRRYGSEPVLLVAPFVLKGIIRKFRHAARENSLRS